MNIKKEEEEGRVREQRGGAARQGGKRKGNEELEVLQ